MARVYISSTYQDMKDCREVVMTALRRMNHQPIGMEDYTAEGSRPLDKCLGDVAGCDAYVGLIGWRYGFVPADGNPDGCSITELEYRKAKALGKPCYVFLQSDENIGKLSDYRTGENERGARIEKLRQALQNELLIDQFNGPDDLAMKAATALARLAQPTGGDSRAALRELKGLGVLILKVYTFQAMFDELHDLYMETRVLRSEDPEGLTVQALRSAARSSRDCLRSVAGALQECDIHLTDSERKLNQDHMTDLDACVTRLADLSAQPEGGPQDQRTVAVDDYNYRISAWLDELNRLSENAWAELRLGELKPLLDRIRPQVPGNVLDRVDDGLRLLNLDPPLHFKCDLLSQERNLLRNVLHDFITLRREIEHLDVDDLRLRCKAIKRRVDQARGCWQSYAKLQGRREPWESDLLGDGADQWEVIDACEADVSTPLAQLQGSGQSIPPGLVDKLMRGQKYLELHFESVDDALAAALGTVKNIMGKPLMDVGALEEEHAGT